ncbi:MAG: hypothetical protein PHN51_10355 [Candidatus Nanopelagicales bacterium]|nr:hypothetical protein [Candidatus Nanopelagicales bacterium]
MTFKWWERLKKRALKRLHKFLVAKVDILDKLQLHHYKNYPTFAVTDIGTNKGVFTFVFKEDRRKRVREKDLSNFGVTSYFVELIAPPELANPTNPLHDKVIVVIKVSVGATNYEVLAELLLDLYLDYF